MHEILGMDIDNLIRNIYLIRESVHWLACRCIISVQLVVRVILI